jgi:class 3 adenylate cyclase
MDPENIIHLLHEFFSDIDLICEKHGLEKYISILFYPCRIKTIGDCYFAVSGVPRYKPLHAKIAMDFAIDVLKMLNEKNKEREENRKIYVRTGLSSGKLVAGIIGLKKFCYDTWGSMVNEAARMEQHGLPGKIQISRSTYEYIFDKFEFIERTIHLQGIGTRIKAYIHTPQFNSTSEMKEKEKKFDQNRKFGKFVTKDNPTDVGNHKVLRVVGSDKSPLKNLISKMGSMEEMEETVRGIGDFSENELVEASKPKETENEPVPKEELKVVPEDNGDDLSLIHADSKTSLSGDVKRMVADHGLIKTSKGK